MLSPVWFGGPVDILPPGKTADQEDRRAGAGITSRARIPIRVEPPVPPSPLLRSEHPVAPPADRHDAALAGTPGSRIDLDQLDRSPAAGALEPSGFTPCSHRAYLRAGRGNSRCIHSRGSHRARSRDAARIYVGRSWLGSPVVSLVTRGRSRTAADVCARSKRAVTLSPLLLGEQHHAFRAECADREPIRVRVVVASNGEPDNSPARWTEETRIRSPGSHGCSPYGS